MSGSSRLFLFYLRNPLIYKVFKYIQRYGSFGEDEVVERPDIELVAEFFFCFGAQVAYF